LGEFLEEHAPGIYMVLMRNSGMSTMNEYQARTLARQAIQGAEALRKEIQQRLNDESEHLDAVFADYGQKESSEE
jgi:hypothetical protein